MENSIKPDRHRVGFSLTKTVSIWPQISVRGIVFPHLAAESFSSQELQLTVKHRLGSLLATEPASGKRANANQRSLGTGTLCSTEEEEDDSVCADVSTLQLTQRGSNRSQLAELQIVTALRPHPVWAEQRTRHRVTALPAGQSPTCLMRVPAEERAGAPIAAASRGSPIKRPSAGGAAQPSAPLPCRDEPERCRSCSHLAAPSNKCFCLFTAGSPAAWAPGDFASPVSSGSRVPTPKAEAAGPAL